MLVVRSVQEAGFLQKPTHNNCMARLVPAHSERREVKDVEVFSYRAFQLQELETTIAEAGRQGGKHSPEPISQRQKDEP